MFESEVVFCAGEGEVCERSVREREREGEREKKEGAQKVKLFIYAKQSRKNQLHRDLPSN